MIRCLTYLVLLGAVTTTRGFMVDSPESIAQAEKRNADWRARITENFDLPHLRLFLISATKDRSLVDGVDVRKAKIADMWTLEDASLTCGNWVLVTEKPESEKFEIVWTVADVPDAKSGGGIWKLVTLECRKSSRDKFELLNAKYSEEEYIHLSP